jgi:hypothetical protein
MSDNPMFLYAGEYESVADGLLKDSSSSSMSRSSSSVSRSTRSQR